MAKIKINKLPEGFKLVKGKVVENELMKDGGMLNTGDQADYGLVTTPQEYYSNTNFNNTDDKDVRYSLSSVPRDRANIEAEGGETVLTDLTNDGQFGLYNITGPRHNAGGVPMFLPEQSFIYSDTEKMKFTKDELADFGIKTKKKMSPAKLSKKYELNDYYGHLESPYADKIQAVTSELMLKKNMMNLSKVAFGQESKKKFEDGVPLAAHPYLVQQGIDPLEFTAKMETITREEAQMKMMASLPPEQQEQMMMLQQMMAQVDQQEGAPQEQMPQQAMARYGAETHQKAQVGTETKPNVAYDQSMQDRYTNDFRVSFNDIGVGATTYDDVQSYSEDGLFADASDNIKGFQEAYGNYPGMEEMITSLPEYGSKKNPEVLKFQKWFNEVSIPEQVASMRAERERFGKEFTDEDETTLIESLRKDYAIPEDGLFGVETSSRRPFTYKDAKIPEEEIIEDTPRGDLTQIIPKEYTPPKAEWWKQDQNNLTALGLLDDNLYLPFQPDVQRTTLSPTFDDWRGAVNANNAAADQVANQLGAAGGPQAIANSNIAGTLMEANAKAQRSVNSANVNTDNQFAVRQGQMDAQFNQLDANRKVAQYDANQKVLQNADNFRNWRTGENAKLQNAALTNKANTFNLNTLYDNYAIDPRTGGMVGFTNPNALKKVGPKPDNQKALLDAYTDLRKNIPGDQKIDMDFLKLYMGMNNNSSRDMTNAQAEAMKKGMATGRTTAQKGKETKRMVVPFYTGKMGG